MNHQVATFTRNASGRVTLCCECGKRYSGQSTDRAFRSHAEHAAKLGFTPTWHPSTVRFAFKEN